MTAPEPAATTAARADAGHRVVLDLGRRRPPAHPAVHRLPDARPPAGADLPGVPQPRVDARRWCPAAATVVGFTVNQHQWLPGLRAAVRDRRSSRWTRTRPSASRPTSSAATPTTSTSARRSQVRFEQHDDVWLPLFEPTGETDATEPRRRARAPDARAPPLSDERFEHRSVLSGVGRSAIGRRLMVDPLSLTVDACLAAVADAGLTLDDIDGLSTYPGAGGDGHERGRRHRGRGGAAPAPDVDQRRRRPARARAAR